MVRVGLSKYTKDFIDAADVSGNLKNNIVNKLSLNAIDNVISRIGRSKFVAVYPMIGANQTTMVLNYIDPRDLDAAFRLTPFGSGASLIAYTDKGADFSAITAASGKATFDTYLEPATVGQGSLGHYLYHTSPITNVDNGYGDNSSYFEFGTLAPSANYIVDVARTLWNGSSVTFYQQVPDYRGFVSGNIKTNDIKLFKNGQLKQSSSGTVNNPTAGLTLTLGARRNTAGQTDSQINWPGMGIKTCSFAFYTNTALTTTEHAMLYNTVNFVQRNLGRI